jgi:bifunctional non-homologous end joining protein LigD
MSVSCQRILPAGFIEPCIPTVASVPPLGPGWVHEIKHDGYRLVGRLEGRRVRLFTRRGNDWSDRFPRISEALASLKATSATIDGEAVVLCPKTGLSLFDELHDIPESNCEVQSLAGAAGEMVVRTRNRPLVFSLKLFKDIGI